MINNNVRYVSNSGKLLLLEPHVVALRQWMHNRWPATLGLPFLHRKFSFFSEFFHGPFLLNKPVFSFPLFFSLFLVACARFVSFWAHVAVCRIVSYRIASYYVILDRVDATLTQSQPDLATLPFKHQFFRYANEDGSSLARRGQCDVTARWRMQTTPADVARSRIRDGCTLQRLRIFPVGRRSVRRLAGIMSRRPPTSLHRSNRHRTTYRSESQTIFRNNQKSRIIRHSEKNLPKTMSTTSPSVAASRRIFGSKYVNV